MHRAEISSREEHLRKLNEELDARKDEVLKQADQVVRIQESILNSAPASEADDGSYHGVSIIPPASPKRWNLVVCLLLLLSMVLLPVLLTLHDL
jgi:hypothetical protein